MVNIDAVASRAGVSRSTVSRVIRGSDKVKSATKEKILEVIQEMNYSPNNAARTLASRKSYSIGVISSYVFSDPFYSTVAEEIYRVCEKKGYNVLFIINRTDEVGHRDPIDILNGKVDGFIYLGDYSVTEENLVKLLEMRIPVGVFKTGVFANGVIEACINNVQGAYMGTEYLIKLGHRKIAIMRGKLDHYESSERILGYKKALEKYEIPYDESLAFDGNFSYNDAFEIAADIINSGATAVFCMNDVMAHGFISGAKHQKCRIPEDISVLGYDDINFTNYNSFVELTTVKQPIKEMGQYLSEAILEQIEEGINKGRKIFATELVEEETTRKR